MSFNPNIKNSIFIFLPLIAHIHLLPCDNNPSIQHLSLDQKIGQLFMVSAVADEQMAKDVVSAKSYKLDKDYITKLIQQHHIGGIIYLGKSDPAKQIIRTQHYQKLTNIPLLVGQDLEPGRVGTSRLTFMQVFPNNQTLGEINNTQKTYQTALNIGQRCKQLGVHINFAPVADVNNNPNNPIINDRSFGDNPELVAIHSKAFAQGLHDANIIACAKHFPGHGDTTSDSHNDLPHITHDKDRLDTVELYPFKELIKDNIPAIMIGHLAIPALETQKNLPSSLSKNIVTELLQKTLNFNGLIITDALDMGSITKQFTDGQAELNALLAGNDILLCSTDVPRAIAVIKNAIEKKLIDEQEIDAHVQKILNIKKEYNVLDTNMIYQL